MGKTLQYSNVGTPDLLQSAGRRYIYALLVSKCSFCSNWHNSMKVIYYAVQSQTAVTAHFLSKQLLLFYLRGRLVFLILGLGRG